MLTLTYNEMNAQQKLEVKTYGCLKEEMREATAQAIKQRFGDDAEAYAIHLIRNARDMLQHNAHDQMVVMDARQQIDRALWVLNTYYRT